MTMSSAKCAGVKMAKRSQTRSELVMRLREQIDLLTFYCENFDDGKTMLAKPMATVLRILLHTSAQKNSNTIALTDHLGLRNGRWRSVAALGDPRSHPITCTLIGVLVHAEIGPDGSSALSLQSFPYLSGLDRGLRRIPFVNWWTEPIAYNHARRVAFSRMDVVRKVTDTDGGAHVDGSLDADYIAFKDGEFLGMCGKLDQKSLKITLGHERGDPLTGAVAATIRAIAHEVLLTLQSTAPEAFSRPYTFKPRG
ncbi:hypothetical protein [Massilia sp. YIM B02443]|uniref:hypothetical protein n=1 Tax=Massilia sp. YIM B02443 TaxID=3050127 RepID=UPI0025B639BC|nr:hypothetical protein [Massilia sp. YIM B02443]MDN4038661.1 hypothetical protein [Massilia sp. YIM B02443]